MSCRRHSVSFCIDTYVAWYRIRIPNALSTVELRSIEIYSRTVLYFTAVVPYRSLGDSSEMGVLFSDWLGINQTVTMLRHEACNVNFLNKVENVTSLS